MAIDGVAMWVIKGQASQRMNSRQRRAQITNSTCIKLSGPDTTRNMPLN